MPALFRAFIACCFALVLMACQEDGPDYTGVIDGGEFGETLLSGRKAACETEGGRWGAGGPGGTFVCYTPHRDAGQRCSLGSDCDGLCLARSRTCAPVSPFIGCHQAITNGGLPATICVE